MINNKKGDFLVSFFWSWFWALFLKVQTAFGGVAFRLKKIESKIHQQNISPKVVET